MTQWLGEYPPDDVEGAFGLGAFAGDDQSSLAQFAFPYMTVGASLDGGPARITRIA